MIRKKEKMTKVQCSVTTTTTTTDTKSPKIGRRKIPPNEENETPARYINGFPEYEKKFGNGLVMFWCEICHRYTHTHSTGSHVGMSGDEEKKTKKKDHNDDDKKEGKKARRGRYKKKCERLSRVSSNRRNENKSE